MTEHVVGRDRGSVKIGETEWTVKPMTRSAARASKDIKTDVGDNPTFDEIDSQAKALIGYIDKRLDGSTEAGPLLEGMWESDSLGIDDLSELAEFLAPSENGSSPPR